MSTGAILARGGCRALKWVALFGAVLALGVGTASAQITVTGPSGDMVNEGDDATYTVTVTGYVATSTESTVNRDVVVAVVLPTPTGDTPITGEVTDITTNRGLIATITAPPNPSEDDRLRFTGSATVIIGTTHDRDAEDETFTLVAPTLTTNSVIFDGPGVGAAVLAAPTTTGFPTTLTIKDDETQSYDLTLDAGQTPINEGEPIELTLTANPAHEDGSANVNVYLDVPPTVATITAGDTGVIDDSPGNRDVTITPPNNNDKNRSTDTIVVSAYTSVSGSPTPRLVSELSIEVKDRHVLPGADAVTVNGIWDSQTGGKEVESVTEGGDAVYVEFEVDRGTGGTAEELDLALTVNPSREAASYRFDNGGEVTFPSGSGKQTRRLKLEALSDDFVNDDMLTLSFELTGESGNQTNETDAAKNSTSGSLAPITVVNATATQIEAKPEAELTTAVDAAIAAGTGEDGVNPGESFVVQVANLFAKFPPGSRFSPSLSGDPAVTLSTSGSTVADGVVTVTAQSVGTAIVTVTVDAPTPSSARVVPQILSTSAEVAFDVTVENKPLRVALTADPASMVDEGGTITLTAAITDTDRVVLMGENATVDLEIVGPVVGDRQRSVTIPVGEKTASVELQVVDDDEVVTDPKTVTVIATGGGLVEDPTRLAITVAENDVETIYTYTFTASADAVVEGEAVTLTVTADPAVETETMVRLNVSPTSLEGDYTLNPEIITIPVDGTSGTAMLTAVDDAEVEDDETLTVSATGPGNVLIDTLEITLNDNDPAVPAVSAKDGAADMIASAIATVAGDAPWMAGGMAATVDMSGLFDVDDGVTAAYAGVSSDNDVVRAISSGNTLTLTPMGAGSATITVTATGGDVAATVTHDATVVPEALYVELTADRAMVDEGGTITLTASANRPVLAGDDATVSLEVVGPVVERMESIAIAVGSSSNTVVLQVTDDSVVKDLGTVTVIASGGSLREDPTRLEIPVIENDQPTPVVPTVRAKDGAAGMIASAIATVAGSSPWMVGGMAATVDMSMLFDLDDGVTAAYSGVSSDDDVVRAISSGKTLTLTPMGAGSATITVTGSDTAGGGVATVTHDAAVALETLVVTVAASADMVDEGGSVMVTATANRAVTEATMLDVTVTGADADAVSADESITIAMGGTTGSATVTAVEDADSDDANVTVVVSGTSLSGPITFNIAITDNDATVAAKSAAEATAVFVTAVATASGADGWLPGGEAASIDMSELFTPNGSPTLEYEVMSSAAETVAASASGSMLTLMPMETGEATITVTATDTSGDAADTATVMGTVTVGVLPLEVMVSPATAEVTEGGGAVEITATANKMVDANVEVMLIRDAASSAGEADFELEPVMITIMAGEVTGKTMLKAVDDYEVEGTESLTLVARVKDMGDIGSVMVSIVDDDMTTTYTLTGPMDMNIVEGQSYELTATASQAVRVDTTVTFMRDRAASDAGDGDYSVESITIRADQTSGTTMLMVTEDDLPDGGTGTNMGESLVLIGSVDGMEIGSLTFTIWDEAVPVLPVIAQLLLAGLLGIGGYRRYRRR